MKMWQTLKQKVQGWVKFAKMTTWWNYIFLGLAMECAATKDNLGYRNLGYRRLCFTLAESFSVDFW